jgi:excisionase family DNA binding protein
MQEITFENLPKSVFELYNKVENIERLLLNRSNENQPEAEQLLTVQQVAEMLGLTVPTLYGFTQRNEIPFNKKGKRLIFLKHEILSWVKEGRRKTVKEIAENPEQFLAKRKGAKNE